MLEIHILTFWCWYISVIQKQSICFCWFNTLIHSTIISCVFIRRKFQFWYGNHLKMKNRSFFRVVFLTIRKIFFLIPLSDSYWMHCSYFLIFLAHNSVSCWCQTFNIWPRNLRTSERERENLRKMLAIRGAFFSLNLFGWFIFL